MKHALILISLLLAGCADNKYEEQAKEWATVKAKPRDSVPKSCANAPPPPIPQGSELSDQQSARYTTELLGGYGKLAAQHNNCGAWARKQR